MKRVWENHKNVFIIFSIVIALIIVVLIGILIGKKNSNQEKRKIEVDKLGVLTPLSYSDSAAASELIKENIMKVVNKVGENYIIGTGFFDKSGYLITNSHIVDIKGDITVEFPNGEIHEAQLYSNDITSDIALLSVENPNVKALYFGETLNLNVTDDVYAIGYAYALKGEASVTKGILSARRSAGGIEFLQSDISLNTGNSGGPLINDKGELLGINTYATGNASIGMSISTEALQNIILKLIDSKSANYLTEDRPQNALSVVLKEIGFTTEDIYNEKELVKEINEDNEENKESDNNKHENNNKTTTTKSSNTNLSSLTVANYDIGFSSSKTDYYITLKNEETSLNINANCENLKSKYIISGNSNFSEGKNKVTITVTAENGNTKEYIINVTKPLTYLDGAAGILCCLDVQKYKGVNSLVVSGCDFVDSDGIRIYPNTEINIIKSVRIDVYAGWNNSNVNNTKLNKNGLRFLKTFNFNSAYSYGMPLTELRALLNDEDYEGGIYSGADLTVYITINTKKQGSFTEIMPWGLSK